jgi:hypothetical protein
MNYSFLPWVRQGLAAGITPGATTSGGARATVPVSVELKVNAEAHPVPLQVSLYGPGDVTSIDPRAILRTVPAAGAALPAGTLAAIEFERADLPWLFSPKAASGAALDPWLALCVVDPDHATVQPATAARLAVLTVEGPAVAQLGNPAEAGAWAHAQIAGTSAIDPAALGALVNQHPEATCSRLLAPRRLDSGRRYLACLVPTFEAGRRAGLGLPAGGGAGWAWSPTALRVDLPIYYQWALEVSSEASFRELVERLAMQPLGPEIGARAVRAAPLPGAPAFDTTVRGAFVSPRAPAPVLPAAYAQSLQALLGAPVTLVPPRYGEAHAPSRPPWLQTLNAALEDRVAAAQGTKVVQTEQEALVEAAWAATPAPSPLATPVAGAVGSVLGRRLANGGPLFAARVRATTDAAAGKAPPGTAGLASVVPAVLRLTSPAGAVARRVRRMPTALPVVIGIGLPQGPGTFGSDTRLDAGRLTPAQIDAAPPAPRFKLVGDIDALPGGPMKVTLDIPLVHSTTVIQVPWHLVPESGGTDDPAGAAFRQAARAVQQWVATVHPARPPGTVVFFPGLFGASWSSLATSVTGAVLTVPGAVASGPAIVARAAAAPSLGFRYPMWRTLCEQGPEQLIPNLDRVKLDSVGVLALRAEYVESFLAGLNHELWRELTWRNVPIASAPTAFRSFFGAAPEVPPMTQWTVLGQQLAPELRGASVLLVRGAVIHSHPNLTLSAIHGTTLLAPVFRGRLDPQTLFAGFAVPTDQLATGGWFFAFEEQPTEPFFNQPGSGASPAIAVADLGLAPGASAAQVAQKLLRRPMRIVMPAARLLASDGVTP